MSTDTPQERTYIAIDLKSFYAAVECVERGLDPLTTNLVVADASRTAKTICLAVSPSLKAYGIAGRARLFEVLQRVGEVNRNRRQNAPNHILAGESCDDTVLKASPSLAVGFITAPPQMAHYIEWSARIYQLYLKYIAPEDIHVYSIDEVVIDATDYLPYYGLSARELASMIARDVLQTTGITVTAGIGTNLYLSKVAMDIVAKHIRPDSKGVRIARLNEITYRRLLWRHQPLTDFWRVGRGYARKLAQHGIYTMGDIARCSLGKPNDYYNEDLLYQMFGINAELLIDHAWGWEPCTIADIKRYRPSSKSISSGQVLKSPYSFSQARLVVQEMADLLALDLVGRRLVIDQIVLTVGYDRENLTHPETRRAYHGAVTADRYGRTIPKHAHGTANLDRHTFSAHLISNAVLELYDRIVNKTLTIRRIYLSANHVLEEDAAIHQPTFEQLDLFTDYNVLSQQRRQQDALLARERKMQQAVLSIKSKHGKNAILKGTSLQESATARERNCQIGGHRA